MDCIICYKIFLKEFEFVGKPVITTAQHSDLALNVGKLLSVTPQLLANALRNGYLCYDCLDNFSKIDGLYKELESIKSKLSNHKDQVEKQIFHSKRLSDVQFSNGNFTIRTMSGSSSARIELFEELTRQELDETLDNHGEDSSTSSTVNISEMLLRDDTVEQDLENDSKIDIEDISSSDRDPFENAEIRSPNGISTCDVNDEPNGLNQMESKDGIILIDITQILNGSEDGNKSVSNASNSNDTTVLVTESEIDANQNEANYSSKERLLVQNKAKKGHFRNKRLQSSVSSDSDYQCGICLNKFSCTSSLHNHLKTHSSTRADTESTELTTKAVLKNVVNSKNPMVLSCQDCHKPFTSLQLYNVHTKKSRSVATKCKFINCNKEFFRLGCIRYHNSIEHPNGMKKKMTTHATTCASVPAQSQNSKIKRIRNFCQICQIKCSSKEFKDHNKTVHSITDSNNCPICEKHFSSPNSVRSHLLIHFKINPYKCSIEGCGETFRRKYMLINHEKNHSSTKTNSISRRTQVTQINRTFSCLHCPLQFSLQELLRQHTVSEHEEMIFYPCRRKVGCMKKFKLAIVRNIHEKMHENQRKVKEVCKDCGKSFQNKNTLATHVNVIHTKESTFMCPHINCGRKFMKHNYLKKHLKRHEPNQTKKSKFSCNFCDKKVKSSTELKNHLRQDHNNSSSSSNKVPNNQQSEDQIVFPSGSGNEVNSIVNVEMDNPQHFKNAYQIIKNPDETLSCRICSKVFNQMVDIMRHMDEHKSVEKGKMNRK